MTDTAFQDAIGPANLCWGCGPANTQGLRLKSHWDGEEAVSRFVPQPQHAAGPPDVLNGGVIATIVDCHCVCTAVAARYRAEGRDIGSGPVVWCVTGSLEVRYRRPTPLDAPVLLRARVLEVAGRRTRLACSVVSGGEEKATGIVVAVHVPGDWLGRGHGR